MENDLTIVGIVQIIANAPGFVTPVFLLNEILCIQDIENNSRVGFVFIANKSGIKKINPTPIRLHNNDVVYGFYLAEGIILFRNLDKMKEGLKAILSAVVDRPALSRSIQNFLKLESSQAQQKDNAPETLNNFSPQKNLWTDETVEQLRALWASGLSSTQIGDKLGFTRNQVILKVYRLGLSGRKQKSPKKPLLNIFPSADVRSIPSVTTRRVELEPETSDFVNPSVVLHVDFGSGADQITILDLSGNTCKWPIGDPLSEEFCFCGHTPKSDSPYCEYHARLAYSPLVKAVRSAISRRRKDSAD